MNWYVLACKTRAGVEEENSTVKAAAVAGLSICRVRVRTGYTSTPFTVATRREDRGSGSSRAQLVKVILRTKASGRDSCHRRRIP